MENQIFELQYAMDTFYFLICGALVMWMAGGNVKGGATIGGTDAFSLRAAEESVSIRDVHATILDLMGLDDELLRFHHAGRLRRLTDIGGTVLKDMIAG